jgi:hypothetical protein
MVGGDLLAVVAPACIAGMRSCGYFLRLFYFAGALMQDLRDWDYTFYMANRAALLSDIRLVQSQKKKLTSVLPAESLYVWQQMLLDMVLNHSPDDRFMQCHHVQLSCNRDLLRINSIRHILWVTDAQGGGGKTAASRFLVHHHEVRLAFKCASFGMTL